MTLVPLGNLSRLRLASCDIRIQRFAEAVAAGVDAGECPGVTDVTVLCGWRNQVDQDAAFKKGASKLQWPNSKHNHTTERGDPDSLAVDLAPYPINWADKKSFLLLRQYALQVADRLDIRIRIISWDWPHYELA